MYKHIDARVEPGRVIRVKASLTQLIKYPGLTRFCIGSRALIMVSVPDQSNELSVLDDDDDGSASPDFLYHILKD